MKKLFATLFTISLLSNASCSLLNQSRETPLDFLEKGAKMDIKKFFNGEIEGFAITQNEEGKIIDTKIIKAFGRWDDSKGTLRQEVLGSLSDKKENRTWLISLFDDGTFDAIGHDVTSPAKGQQKGNAAQMNYTLLLQKDGVKTKVKFEDKMYLVDDKSIIMISNFVQDSGGKGKTIISLKKISKSEGSKSEQARFEQFKAEQAKAEQSKIDQQTKLEKLDQSKAEQKNKIEKIEQPKTEQ